MKSRMSACPRGRPALISISLPYLPPMLRAGGGGQRHRLPKLCFYSIHAAHVRGRGPGPPSRAGPPQELSVVSTMAETEALFSMALRQTLVGSTMPMAIMSPNLSFAAS